MVCVTLLAVVWQRPDAPHQIQSITGHKSLAEVETYTKAVDQLRLAESGNPLERLASLDGNQLEMLKNLSSMALPSGIAPVL
jgi:hypothetical protein